VKARLFSSFMRNRLWTVFLIPLLLFAAWECDALTAEDICARKESLCRSLEEKGFTAEEIGVVLSDRRIVLYPENIGKKGKGLDYFGRNFGLLTCKSIDRGRKILRDNSAVLTDIGERLHVEPEVLVAVYRVETNFGQYVGTYPVINSLLTMTLIENRRSGWAESELVNLFVLARMSNADPVAIKGSWAGAFGLCQFIPSSFLNYGVDGNNDGTVDLFQFADAMASIANYLSGHGWVSGDPDKMKKAIYAYNHCDNYVQAVLAYAEAITKPCAKAPGKKKTASHKKRKPSRHRAR
jgi:membrane-bound lytic murein transglycosylase B